MLLFSLVIIININCQKKVDISVEKAAIKAVLDNCRTGMENEDITLIGNIFAHDTDNVFWGTGVGEKMVGWKAFETAVKEQYEALSETKITQSDLAIKVSKDGQFAYATSQYDVKAIMGEQEIELLGVRETCILEKRDAEWVIVHIHDSIGSK